MMKLSIIIVNYKTKDLLELCLNSILADQPADSDREVQAGSQTTNYGPWTSNNRQIIVIDNHSEDGSVEMVRGKFPEVQLLVNETNVGYARAINQGIRIAEGEYLLLMNPDVQVKPGAIERMVRFMDENQQVGIVGGKLLNPDGTLQYSCRTFYTFRTLLLRRTPIRRLFPNSTIVRNHLMMDWDHASVREVDWVLGACMLVRRKALEDVGNMDERFFLYFEDVDWCYRMKKGGWKVCYFPHAEMIHLHRRESAQGPTHLTFFSHLRSMLHFFDKWSDLLYFLRKYNSLLTHIVFAISDILAINLSFYMAYQLRKSLALGLSDGIGLLEKPDLPFSIYRDFLIFINITTFTVFHFLHLYKFPRGLLWVDELFRVFKAMGISCLMIMAGTYLIQGYEFSRSITLLFGILGSSFTFLFRWTLSGVFRFLRKQGFDLKRVLILGTGLEASILKKELDKHRELGYDVVGFVAMPRKPGSIEVGKKEEKQQISPAFKSSNTHPPALPILGTLEDLPHLITDQKINEVIVTELDPLQDEIFNLIAKNGTETLHVRVVTDVSEILTPRATIEELAGIPTITFEADPLHGINLFLKRALDLTLSLIGIIFLFPLFLGIAILIKWESPGPVLFRQERVGRNRRRFLIYKFRSMYQQAEEQREFLGHLNEAEEPLFKIRDDPRLTRVGKILRRFSLDELPQLINVIKGEMSLVGPRPPLPDEVARYQEWQYRRLWVKPGITGLWQVSGRSELSFNEMIKLDLYYIRNWSLSNDLKIILRTIPVALRGKGAY
jgi:exopolysaccharide biosynthesis polyprenyl glycosylphosphotransferase